MAIAFFSRPNPDNGPQLLGLRLDMTEEEASRVLQPLGALAGQEDGRWFWRIDDERFAWMVVEFDRETRVMWATVCARPDGKRVRYEDVGDTQRAAALGDHVYTWTVPGEDGSACRLSARGADPEYLTYLSLYRPPVLLPGA